jgi:2-keto-4-pentenoate hydratase/2-oxohepta-3-ene-1,7-dioic acid hydratase in catechol pathway
LQSGSQRDKKFCNPLVEWRLKFVSFVRGSGPPSPGIWIDGRGILDLRKMVRQSRPEIDASSLLALLRDRDAIKAVRQLAHEFDGSSDFLIAPDSVVLAAPICGLLRNAFCVGRNYREHIREGHRAQGTDMKLPTVPQFFTKATHAINAPHGDVRLDGKATQFLDYEVELAVIIGKHGRDITADEAFDHVFGYTIANDFTARDLQRTHDQWFKGKSLDGTLPLGPWIVDKDEIGDPRTLTLSLDVNGDLRQAATVDMMIFDIPTIIESLSRGMTLEAGDVICTGTPSGVGYAMRPPRALQTGDVVTCTIDRIGTLSNRIVAA